MVRRSTAGVRQWRAEVLRSLTAIALLAGAHAPLGTAQPTPRTTIQAQRSNGELWKSGPAPAPAAQSRPIEYRYKTDPTHGSHSANASSVCEERSGLG